MHAPLICAVLLIPQDLAKIVVILGISCWLLFVRLFSPFMGRVGGGLELRSIEIV